MSQKRPVRKEMKINQEKQDGREGEKKPQVEREQGNHKRSPGRDGKAYTFLPCT